MSAALEAGRRAAEALMLDEGRALRPIGQEYDPAQQAQVTTYDPDFGFTSRCKLQSRVLVAQEAQAGGRTVTTARLELHLPIDTEPLTTGDVWELTARDPQSSAAVGHRFRVQGPHEKTMATARRYDIEAVVS